MSYAVDSVIVLSQQLCTSIAHPSGHVVSKKLSSVYHLAQKLGVGGGGGGIA